MRLLPQNDARDTVELRSPEGGYDEPLLDSGDLGASVDPPDGPPVKAWRGLGHASRSGRLPVVGRFGRATAGFGALPWSDYERWRYRTRPPPRSPRGFPQDRSKSRLYNPGLPMLRPFDHAEALGFSQDSRAGGFSVDLASGFHPPSGR